MGSIHSEKWRFVKNSQSGTTTSMVRKTPTQYTMIIRLSDHVNKPVQRARAKLETMAYCRKLS